MHPVQLWGPSPRPGQSTGVAQGPRCPAERASLGVGIRVEGPSCLPHQPLLRGTSRHTSPLWPGSGVAIWASGWVVPQKEGKWLESL